MSAKRTIFQHKRALLAELTLLYLFPLIIMMQYPQLTILRHVLMVFGGIYFFLLSRHHPISLRDLGLQLAHLPLSLILSLGGTLVGIGLLLTVYFINPTWYADELSTLKIVQAPVSLLIAAYVVLSVPLQELIFRSFLIKRLELITHNHLILILLSAGLFALAHIIFGSFYLIVACFLGGVMWAFLFIRYRNIWPIHISHAILGSIVIWLSLRE